jgi:TetR/AcrR family transcriptional regulator, tetracycline repressor protein
VAKPPELELDANDIVAAAVEILLEQGLDAVSMRNVSARLGVSPVPVYSRIGNKDALLDAIADRLLADLAPPSGPDETWAEYASRWCTELRHRLRLADTRLILAHRREAYVQASRTLIDVMRRNGFSADVAVQSCRLLMWATVGFAAMEAGASPPQDGNGLFRAGGDPGGVTPADTDALFSLQIRYLLVGIANDITGPD